MARVILIGAPETDAAVFEARLRQDLPPFALFATNQREAVRSQLSDCEVLIGHHFQFDDAMVAAAPRLRWIQSLTSGIDGIERLRALSKEVLVTSMRGIHGPQVSELVLLLMLALTRDFPRLLDNQRAHRWERHVQPLLTGKTVVIVGCGAIAEMLAQRCSAFGLRVLGVSATPRTIPGFAQVLPRERLLEAAKLADYFVLLVPFTAANDNLIDERVLRALRPQAYLINVARGGVLDEQALLQALREGRLAGAALDVFRETPLPADSPLWDTERLLITPLIGGMSDIYLQQCYPLVRDNLERYLAGRLDRLVNLVPRPAHAVRSGTERQGG